MRLAQSLAASARTAQRPAAPRLPRPARRGPGRPPPVAVPGRRDPGPAPLADACARGALAQCTTRGLGENQIGDAGITVFAQAIKPVSEGGSGAMASLKQIAVDTKHMRHPGLVAACKARGIKLRSAGWT